MHVYFDRRFHEKKLASDAHSKTYLTFKKMTEYHILMIVDANYWLHYWLYCIYMSYKDGDTGGSRLAGVVGVDNGLLSNSWTGYCHFATQDAQGTVEQWDQQEEVSRDHLRSSPHSRTWRASFTLWYQVEILEFFMPAAIMGPEPWQRKHWKTTWFYVGTCPMSGILLL